MKKPTKSMTHSQYVHRLLHKKPLAAEKQPADKKPSKPSKKPTPEPPTRKAPGRENAHRLYDASPIRPAPAGDSTKFVYDHATLQSIKALSIKQPYAGLIMAGIKNVENRSWFTNYRGPLAIVSTKNPDAMKWWGPMRERCKRLGVEFPEELCQVNASVLGIVDFQYLVYIDERGHEVTDHPTLALDQVATWWNSDYDMVGFIFEHPRLLKTPIPISGRLGLYNLAPEVIAKIIEQM